MMCLDKLIKHAILILIMTAAIGCSGGGGTDPVAPVQNPDEPVIERESSSERTLWGIWEIRFDPFEMSVEIEPARTVLAHFDITDYILPPACDDCFSISVNGFDTVTRILDADVTLRNPMPITGRDVRGILFTNQYGHVITNADGWTELWDIPNGEDINPFKGFAKGVANRKFEGAAEHAENYLVYIPQPPQYWAIQFAVDASWPGNCKEPYEIGGLQVVTGLEDYPGSEGFYTIDVFDWQDDVDGVSIAAEEITGDASTDLTFAGGDEWELSIVNTEAAPVGDYELLVTAISSNSTLPLYQYVSLTIAEGPDPTVTSINPDVGTQGEDLVDVNVGGTCFNWPTAEVKLKMDGEPDIVGTNVEVTGITQIQCDIDIPQGAALGLYDVEVINGPGVGTGIELFEVTAVVPDVTGIDPANALTGTALTDVSVFGSDFQGPGAEVKLKMDGEPDIIATNVVVSFNWLIMCDLDIPLSATPGMYDVEVTNGTGVSGTGEDLFEAI